MARSVSIPARTRWSSDQYRQPSSQADLHRDGPPRLHHRCHIHPCTPSTDASHRPGGPSQRQKRPHLLPYLQCRSGINSSSNNKNSRSSHSREHGETHPTLTAQRPALAWHHSSHPGNRLHSHRRRHRRTRQAPPTTPSSCHGQHPLQQACAAPRPTEPPTTPAGRESSRRCLT